MKRRKIRYQKRIPGVQRIPRLSCIIPEIEERVQAEADRHGVSPSFVVAVRLAHSYGIKKQEQF